MIGEETPGNTKTYGCVVIHTSKRIDIISKMIHCMWVEDVAGVACAWLLLGGLFWFSSLSETAIDPRRKELFLQETGHLKVPQTNKDPNQYIECLARAFYKANPGRFNRVSK